MNPSTASIWLLHENPRFDRTVSMIVFTFPEMALADIPIHSPNALNEKSDSYKTQRKHPVFLI